MRAEAVAAMYDAAKDWANPSSVHADGRRARGRLESARERVAGSLGALPQQIVFTSGGTEALALALSGVPAERVLISAVEHSAVIEAAPAAERIAVDHDGVIDLDHLRSLMETGPALVAVMHANNETGVIQPIADIYDVVKDAGGNLLVDAVQTAGKMSLPPADFLAVSAHKLGGPPGVGVLIARCAEDLQAIQKGGGQERGLRGGTENLPGIAGFAAALEANDRSWLVAAEKRRNIMENRLFEAGAQIFAPDVPRLANTSMIRMKRVAASTQLISLDMAGFAISSGAACSSGKVGQSHVLMAMGVAADAAGEAIRISTGWTTTNDDIDAFCTAWEALAAQKAAT